MSYYSRFDADLCTKLRLLNQAVYEGWMSAHEAAARARLLDPSVYVCEKCGKLQASCLCTVEIPVAVIEEAIRNER